AQGHGAGAAPCTGAVACARRGGRRRWHRALCRFVGRAVTGASAPWYAQRTLRADLQRQAGAAAADGGGGYLRCRRALSRMAAVVCAASEHRRTFAAGIRLLRYLERARARR